MKKRVSLTMIIVLLVTMFGTSAFAVAAKKAPTPTASQLAAIKKIEEQVNTRLTEWKKKNAEFVTIAKKGNAQYKELIKLLKSIPGYDIYLKYEQAGNDLDNGLLTNAEARERMRKYKAGETFYRTYLAKTQYDKLKDGMFLYTVSELYPDNKDGVIKKVTEQEKEFRLAVKNAKKDGNVSELEDYQFAINNTLGITLSGYNAAIKDYPTFQKQINNVTSHVKKQLAQKKKAK